MKLHVMQIYPVFHYQRNHPPTFEALYSVS